MNTTYTLPIEDRLFEDYLKTKDSRSFNKLFELVSPWLHKSIYRITLDCEVSRDIEQDSWICLLRKKKYEKGNLKALIFTIAKNNALMWLRKTKVERAFFKDDYKVNSIDTSTFDEIIQEDNRVIIRQSISQLEIYYQDVAILYYFSELKVKEIANILDVSENTIKTRLRRAKERLVGLLSPIYEKEFSH